MVKFPCGHWGRGGGSNVGMGARAEAGIGGYHMNRFEYFFYVITTWEPTLTRKLKDMTENIAFQQQRRQ